MSDERQPLPHAHGTYQEIVFDGDEIIAVVLEGEGVATPVRLICQSLGLHVQRQSERLREHDVLRRGLRIVRVPMNGQLREVVAILHKYIPLWLATIPAGLVKEEAKPKLIRYQLELVDLLAAIYGAETGAMLKRPGQDQLDVLQQRLADAIIEVRLAREALLAVREQSIEQQALVEAQLGSHEVRLDAIEGVMDDMQQQIATHTTITGPQQEVLKRAINRLSSRYQRKTGKEIYGKLFSEFCIDLGTPKYAALPAGKYDEALAWLRKRAAELLPDDPDALPPLQETLL